MIGCSASVAILRDSYRHRVNPLERIVTRNHCDA